MVTATIEMQETRLCSRCDGEQRLAGFGYGMGKYVCQNCQITIGFDLDSADDYHEFILHRGNPSRYTHEIFGSQMHLVERRL